jgi:hypothetical protein
MEGRSMLLVTGLVSHVFMNQRTGERMYVYKVRGDLVYGLIFGGGRAHDRRRVYLDTLAREWVDIGGEGPSVLAIVMDGPDSCGDPECPIHGATADKSKAPEQRLN